ncbi:unnamed protein product (macronuclear) [Paramecium tetraurelia]|uniref:Uncharacterized protein n=1 Tax=Paramecium tetraurelia TaxID=5888 RepID=A0E557_PARTE|nr:uncharacterized protein GSPATT00023601001 [Paramecium tetraurelia]CAK90424.1 unnamed protein product [Paramecium tetraurelia]|eukprot:XP_001457821.1 hypothetical protein (macronuclear) [Paramecium tetraurelia strain d4-2]
MESISLFRKLVKGFFPRIEILHFIKYELDKRYDVLKRMEEENVNSYIKFRITFCHCWLEYEQDQLKQRKQELIRQYYATQKIHSQNVTTVEKDADLESFIRGNMKK